jgi:hypothetical protein
MRKIAWTLIVAMTLVYFAGCVVAHPNTAPPPLKREVVKPKPGPNHVWISGHWKWSGGRYVWVTGHWTKARKGHAWVPGRWEKRGPRWVYVKGHWRRR